MQLTVEPTLPVPAVGVVWGVVVVALVVPLGELAEVCDVAEVCELADVCEVWGQVDGVLVVPAVPALVPPLVTAVVVDVPPVGLEWVAYLLDCLLVAVDDGGCERSAEAAGVAAGGGAELKLLGAAGTLVGCGTVIGAGCCALTLAA